jgi:hypothetical protein
MTEMVSVPQGALEALTDVAAFLVFAERENPNMRFGARTVSEAVEALAFVIGCTPARLRQVAEEKA